MPEFKLKIAGRVGGISARFGSTPIFLERYVTDAEPDFSVTIFPEDLKYEQKMRDLEALEEGLKPRVSTEPFLERLAILRKFAVKLMDYDILLVHGSAVAVDGVGYLFTAPCGTGKSTHTRLWRHLFGDRAVMINDDKPFIRLSGSGVSISGSPWSGKHGLDTNVEVPLGGICLLERGKENTIRPLSAEDRSTVIRELRWYMEPEQVPVFDGLVESLLRQVPAWHMTCNMEPEAAAMSYEAMRGEKA